MSTIERTSVVNVEKQASLRGDVTVEVGKAVAELTSGNATWWEEDA